MFPGRSSTLWWVKAVGVAFFLNATLATANESAAAQSASSPSEPSEQALAFRAEILVLGLLTGGNTDDVSQVAEPHFCGNTMPSKTPIPARLCVLPFSAPAARANCSRISANWNTGPVLAKGWGY